MNVEEKKEKALSLRKQGYSCSQCLLMVEAEKLGITEEFAAKMAAGLGGGVARGEICGVANALAIAAGLISDDSTSGGKLKVMPVAREMCEEFASPYGGKITCRDLKGKCGVPCEVLICRGIEILEPRLE